MCDERFQSAKRENSLLNTKHFPSQANKKNEAFITINYQTILFSGEHAQSHINVKVDNIPRVREKNQLQSL